MRALFDVNALLALIDKEHTFHPTVRTWWAVNKAGGWATCAITQNGFARIMSQPHYSNPAPTMDAIQLLAMGLEEPDHEFWPDDISYSEVPMDGVVGHRQVTDAYLAQLARAHRGRLASFDQGLAELHRDVVDLVPTSVQQ